MGNAKNNVVLYGRLISEPRFVTTKKGVEFASRFVMAVDRSYKNKAGVIESDFIPVKIIGEERMEFAHMFQKRDNVIVSGQVKSDRYKGVDDEWVYSVYIEADSISWTYGRSSEAADHTDESNPQPVDTKNGFEIELDFKGLPFQ